MTEYPSSGDPARSLELLWRTREPPSRGPKPRLDLDRVVTAAIEVADAEGLGSFSMRRVAERLGVGTMSLYTYVPGKAELLDLMLDTAAAEPAPGPHQPECGWRDRVARIAHENWDRYHRHPWLLEITMVRPVLGPNVIARYDHELAAVDGIGLTDVEMDSVISLLAGHVEGAARRSLEAAQAEQRTGVSDEQWWEARAPFLERVLDVRRFPTAVRVGAAAGEEHNAAYAPAHAFEFGLQRIIEGVAGLITRRSLDG
jgi:AcrR family transcriptional regulator